MRRCRFWTAFSSVTLNPLIVCQRGWELRSRQFTWPIYRIWQWSPVTQNLGSVCKVVQKISNLLAANRLGSPMSSFRYEIQYFKYSSSEILTSQSQDSQSHKALLPESLQPKLPESEGPTPIVTIAQTPSVTISQTPRVKELKHQSHSSPTVHRLILFLFLSNLLWLCPPTNKTAACPYLALKLDKRYATLVRRSVLWTVILFSCLKWTVYFSLWIQCDS